jgi:hypothetical protein
VVAWLLVSAAAAAPVDYAQLRLLNASGVPAPLLALLDDAPLASLVFGQDSGYQPLPSGPHRLTITLEEGAAAPALALDLAPGHLYTIVALPPPADPLVLVDESLAPMRGPALARLVHAVPDAAPLVLSVAEVTSPPTAYAAASPYVEVPAGTRPLLVRTADGAAPLASIPDATLGGDRAYTFVVVGRGASVGILPLLDSSPPGLPSFGITAR